MNGLTKENRVELRLWDVLGLDKIMGLAQNIEEKNNLLKKQFMGPLSAKAHSSIGSPTNPSYSFSLPKHRVALDKGTNKFQSSFKRFSDAELQRRKERGLCYKCDEKFHPGHRCKNKELQVLVFQDMETGDFDQVEEEGLTTEPREGTEGPIKVMEVALNLLVGFSELQTIKMLGIIQGRRVVVLIDGGATIIFWLK